METKNKFSQFGTLLSRAEAKTIRGGDKCVAVAGQIFGLMHCTNSAEEAEKIAGAGGFWCCNCLDTMGC